VQTRIAGRRFDALPHARPEAKPVVQDARRARLPHPTEEVLESRLRDPRQDRAHEGPCTQPGLVQPAQGLEAPLGRTREGFETPTKGLVHRRHRDAHLGVVEAREEVQILQHEARLRLDAHGELSPEELLKAVAGNAVSGFDRLVPIRHGPDAHDAASHALEFPREDRRDVPLHIHEAPPGPSLPQDRGAIAVHTADRASAIRVEGIIKAREARRRKRGPARHLADLHGGRSPDAFSRTAIVVGVMS